MSGCISEGVCAAGRWSGHHFLCLYAGLPHCSLAMTSPPAGSAHSPPPHQRGLGPQQCAHALGVRAHANMRAFGGRFSRICGFYRENPDSCDPDSSGLCVFGRTGKRSFTGTLSFHVPCPPPLCSFTENDDHIFYGVQPKQTPIFYSTNGKFPLRLWQLCDPTRYAASLMNCLAGCRHTAGTVITHRISSPSRTVDDWSFTSCGRDEDEGFDIGRAARGDGGSCYL